MARDLWIGSDKQETRSHVLHTNMQGGEQVTWGKGGSISSTVTVWGKRREKDSRKG